MSDYKKLFRIGYINIFLVLLSYFISSIYGTQFVFLSKLVRVIFLIYSFKYLINIVPFSNIKSNFSNLKYFYLFAIFSIFSALFSNNVVNVSIQLLNFLPSVIFTIVFVNTAYEKLGLKTTQELLLSIYIKTYSLPLITSIFFNGNYYLGNNLYMYNDMFSTTGGVGYESNNLAWSAIIVFASAIAYLSNKNSLKVSKKYGLYTLILFSLMTIINSGSRTILFSLFLYLVVLLFKNYNAVKIFSLKMIFYFIVLFFGFKYLTNLNLDSLTFMVDRTILHIENQENFARIMYLQSGYYLFKEKTMNFIFGLGLFNKSIFTDPSMYIFSKIKGPTEIYSFHNSYAEIFFGGGIPLFFFFFIICIYQSLIQLIKFKNFYYMLFIPLHVIAFTENSLLGGQFIFYPLFFFICVSNLRYLNLKILS